MVGQNSKPIDTLLIASPSFAAEGPKNEEEKTLYAIGLSVARSLSVFSPFSC